MADRIRSLLVGIAIPDSARIVDQIGRSGIGIDATSVLDGDDMSGVLHQHIWDVLIIDYASWSDRYPDLRTLLTSCAPELPVIAMLRALDAGVLGECARGELADCVTWDELPRLGYVVQREIREARERARRREIEQQLELSENRYRVLVQNMHEGVLVVGPDAVITFVNPGMARMLGCAPEEAVGRSVFDFIAPSRRDEARLEFERSLTSKPSTRETLIRTEAGEIVEVLLRTVPIFDESGRMEYGFATVQDITERRELQRQVRQAQKMHAIGQLAGGVAHDFNNVLTIITGNAQLLEARESLSESGRESVVQIRRAAESAAELTRQLLTFSRKQQIQIEVLDLNEVVAKMAPMLRRMIRRNIELILDLAEHLAPTRADRVQIQQVLLNLVINARDAMPGGGTLTIETDNVTLDSYYAATHADVEPGEYVRLSVSDSGVGMEEEVRERIFEPFFTTKQEGDGTGLGLATVYGIVRQVGGWIYVYSEPGEGTVFKIYLPVSEEAPAAAQEAEDEIDCRGDETILIVEDDEQVRSYAAEALTRHGYTVIEADGGAEALRVLEREPSVDLIITDVMMPGITGGELAEEAASLRPELKVLYVSGYNGSAIARAGVVIVEGNEFLQKPFGPDEIARRVREVLDGRLSPPDAPPSD
jgi:two-component system cell cycle sensor histidine kinase/response regulator CckA